ncbi:hypothetical protein BaRGS_00024076 [Batillaria attramentaria]|uniref:Fascin-like domain-containing protein n=1 Tax=Batillaria attramentaria TaxID=370345 RepID=A0ABD0KC48_9CAEN
MSHTWDSSWVGGLLDALSACRFSVVRPRRRVTPYVENRGGGFFLPVFAFTFGDRHCKAFPPPNTCVNALQRIRVAGVDVSANQEEEESDKEIFQMEYDRHTGKWAFRTVDNKYWILEPLGGIQAVGTGM